MTGLLFDTATVTKTALYGGDETWFDVFWYREAPEVRQGRIGEAARSLRDRIVATRIRRPGWWVDLNKVFAMTAATTAPGGRRF